MFPKTDRHVDVTVLSEPGVVVSTIRLSGEMKGIDTILGTMNALTGYEHSDLLTPGDYETMVFPVDKNGDVADWGELDFARYSTEKEAAKGHKAVVKRWEKKNG